MTNEKKLSLTKRRKILVQLFYRYLLMKNTVAEMQQDLLDETQEQLDDETLKIAEQIAKNFSNLIERLKPLLGTKWKWERIPPLVKAILIVGTFEIVSTNIPKAVTVNEMTELAKHWGLMEYKFINAALDKIDKM